MIRKKKKNKRNRRGPKNTGPLGTVPVQFWIGWSQLNPFRRFGPRLPKKY